MVWGLGCSCSPNYSAVHFVRLHVGVRVGAQELILMLEQFSKEELHVVVRGEMEMISVSFS